MIRRFRADGNLIGPGLTRLNRLAAARTDFCPFWVVPDPPTCLRQRGPCGKNRPLGGSLFGRFPEYRACCRSSVVEHSIGNGEVDSSILSGSTILSGNSRHLLSAAAASRYRPNVRRISCSNLSCRSLASASSFLLSSFCRLIDSVQYLCCSRAFALFSARA